MAADYSELFKYNLRYCCLTEEERNAERLASKTPGVGPYHNSGGKAEQEARPRKEAASDDDGGKGAKEAAGAEKGSDG